MYINDKWVNLKPGEPEPEEMPEEYLLKWQNVQNKIQCFAIGYAIEELCNKINDNLFDSTEVDDSLFLDDSDTNAIIEDCHEESESEEDLTTKPTCPECGEPLVFEGMCNVCKVCGWSKCDQME